MLIYNIIILIISYLIQPIVYVLLIIIISPLSPISFPILFFTFISKLILPFIKSFPISLIKFIPIYLIISQLIFYV